jgi:hypothetical protein
MKTINQWFFENEGEGKSRIEYQSPELLIKVIDYVSGPPSIGVFDLLGGKEYWVGMNTSKDVPEGDVRPLIILPGGYELSDPKHWKWMSLEDKEKMKKLMRKAASYRNVSMPIKYAEIWTKCIAIVENLDIINSGMSVTLEV